MGFCVKGTIIAMGLLVGLKPWLVVESLGLQCINTI